MTQLDSENYSEALIKRLEDERGKIVDASRHDYTDIYRWDPDGIALEEVDSDDGWDDDVVMNNANISKTFRVSRYNCQIPEDYLDLQRQFVALHPSQFRPLSIERPDGSLVQPNEKHFEHGETIVFREFGIYNNDGVERPSDAIRASLVTKAQARDVIEDTVEARPPCWPRGGPLRQQTTTTSRPRSLRKKSSAEGARVLASSSGRL